MDSICDLGGLTKEVKVSADWLLGRGVVATESVVVENIVGLVELVTKSIVGILEVKTDVCQLLLQFLNGATYASSSSSAGRERPANGSGALPKPRSRGWLESKPKNDMVAGYTTQQSRRLKTS